MELEIYLTNTLDIVVKEIKKSAISYFIRAPRNLFSTPPFKVYRGPSEWSPHIATITEVGFFKSLCEITIPEGGTITLKPRKFWSSERRFVFEGKDFAWGRDKLIDCTSGKTLAEFSDGDGRTMLNIKHAGISMIDIIVFTALTMRTLWGNGGNTSNLVAGSTMGCISY